MSWQGKWSGQVSGRWFGSSSIPALLVSLASSLGLASYMSIGVPARLVDRTRAWYADRRGAALLLVARAARWLAQVPPAPAADERPSEWAAPLSPARWRLSGRPLAWMTSARRFSTSLAARPTGWRLERNPDAEHHGIISDDNG